MIDRFGEWGQRWARAQIDRGDLDAGLLMWDIHRRVDVAVLPPERVVVRVDFLGVPATMRCPRTWWLLLARSEVDLCLKDPRLPGRRRRDRRPTSAHPGLDGRRPHGRRAPCRLDPARRAAVPRPRLPDLAPAEQLRPRRAGRHHGRPRGKPGWIDHLPSGNRPTRWSRRARALTDETDGQLLKPSNGETAGRSGHRLTGHHRFDNPSQ
jgi:hypothetical protein